MTSDQQQIYDAAWWHSTAKDQRLGWMAGYIDCATRHGNKVLRNVSWYNLEPEISKFYISNPKEAGLDVAAVVSRTARDVARPNDTGGDSTGGFDGEYWRQTEEQREGFIQGFLSCHEKL